MNRLVTVKKELVQYQEQKKYDNELKLADAGIDPRLCVVPIYCSPTG